MPSEEKAVNGESGDGAAAEMSADLRLATLILNVARELKRSVPAPRAAPYFGLDSDVGYDLVALDSLSSRGIFRKYELVLLFGSGLGGSARWLSRRLGCRILGIDADVDRTRAARKLNDAAAMNDDVFFAAGRYDRLPFRDRVFTHVWMIDPTVAERSAGVLAESFRVLRSGAHFGMQLPARAVDELAAVEEILAAVGFGDFSRRSVKTLPPSHSTTVAQSRVRAAVGDGEVRRLWRSRELVGPGTAVQVFCRRP